MLSHCYNKHGDPISSLIAFLLYFSAETACTLPIKRLKLREHIHLYPPPAYHIIAINLAFTSSFLNLGARQHCLQITVPEWGIRSLSNLWPNLGQKLQPHPNIRMLLHIATPYCYLNAPSTVTGRYLIGLPKHTVPCRPNTTYTSSEKHLMSTAARNTWL